MDIPRKGWDKAFALMHERGEDALLVDDGLDLGATPFTHPPAILRLASEIGKALGRLHRAAGAAP